MADIQQILGAPPTITPLVGAEGRNFERPSSSLENFAKIAGVGLELYGQYKEQKDAEEAAAVMGEINEDIELSVASTIDPTVLDEIESAGKRITSLEVQGIRTLDVDLARNKTYVALAAKYANNPEAMEKIDDVFKRTNPMAEDLEVREKELRDMQQKNYEAGMVKIRDTLNNNGFNTTSMTDGDAIALYNEKFASQDQQLAADKLRLEDLRRRVDSNKLRREDAALQAMDLLGEAAGKVLSGYQTEANNIISNPNTTREEKLTQLTTYVNSVKAQVYQSSNGVLTPAQVDEKFKAIQTLYDGHVQILSGEFSGADATVMENRNKLITAASVNNLFNNQPDLADRLARLDALGNSMRNVDPVVQRSILGKFSNQLAQDVLGPQSTSGGLTQGDARTGGSNAAEKATDLSTAIRGLNDINEVSATAMSKLVVRGLNDYESGNSNVMFNMIGGLADPKMVGIIQQSQNQEELIARVAPAVEKFGSDVLKTAQSRLKTYEGKYTKEVTKEGLIKLRPSSNNSQDLRALQTIENTINNSIKAMAHVNGSTDYNSVWAD